MATTTSTTPPIPTDRESFNTFASPLGLTDPDATTTSSTTTATSAAAASTSKEADPSAQTVATDGAASASASDPLGTAAASTALTSPTPTSESSNTDNSDDLQQASTGMSSGTKIGIGVGVGVGVAVIIALIALFFIMRRRRKNKYSAGESAEQIRGGPAMMSTEPALGGASALGRSLSYRSTKSYHSLSPTEPPPLPETAADPIPEASKGTIPAQPTIIPPSQQSLPREPNEAQTPRSRPSMEADIIRSPGAESLMTPAPPYDEAPSPMEEHPERSISPVSPVSSMGSRPPSLRRSFDS